MLSSKEPVEGGQAFFRLESFPFITRQYSRLSTRRTVP